MTKGKGNSRNDKGDSCEIAKEDEDNTKGEKEKKASARSYIPADHPITHDNKTTNNNNWY